MPPSGWYPDPANDANIRFWDGAGWTDRVQPKSVPPPPVAPPPAPPPNPYGAPPPPGPAGYPTQGPGHLIDPWGPAPAANAPAGKLGPDNQVLSGWWRRVGGYLIDSLIAGIPAAIAWSLAFLVVSGNGGSVIDQQAVEDVVAQFEAGAVPSNSDLFSIFAPGFWTTLAVSAAVWLVISLFNGVYLVSRSGQTIGDRAVNNRKVLAGRVVPGLGTSLARWLIPNVLFSLIGNIVPFGFILTWGDYLWPLWDGKAQTVHDKMVKTYVERSDLAGPPVTRR